MGFIKLVAKDNLFHVSKKMEEQFEQYIHALIEWQKDNNNFQLTRRKLYMIQDSWFLSQLGESYNDYIVPEEVALKKVRLELVKFLSKSILINQANNICLNHMSLSFILAFQYSEQIQGWYENQLQDNNRLTEFLDYYQDREILMIEDTDHQLKIVEEFKSKWFIHEFYLTTLLNELVQKAKLMNQAFIDLLGENYSETLDKIDMYSYIDCIINGTGLIEVSYWKSKFLPTLLDQKGKLSNSTNIVCVQQDESMRAYKNFQMGLASAIAHQCEEGNCDFVLIPYAQTTGKELYKLKGKMKLKDYVEMCKQDIESEGPINYKEMINIAFTMLKLEVSRTAGDIIIICNEKILDDLTNDSLWRDAVLNYKKEMKITIYVCFIGEKERMQQIWFADQIIYVEDIAAASNRHNV